MNRPYHENALAQKKMSACRRVQRHWSCALNFTPAAHAFRTVFLTLSIALAMLLGSASSGIARDADINGLVIDQTQTRVGAEFYRLFSLFWEPPRLEESRLFSITIVERASAQWGFWIWILVNDTVAFQSTMKPQSDDMERDVRTAVSAVQQHIVAWSRGEIITEQDMSGSGI